MSMKDRVQHLMTLRREILAQHPELMKIFGGACPEKEAIVAQYVLAAAMLEVDASIQAQAPS